MLPGLVPNCTGMHFAWNCFTLHWDFTLKALGTSQYKTLNDISLQYKVLEREVDTVKKKIFVREIIE